jgi:hypothetical protein
MNYKQFLKTNFFLIKNFIYVENQFKATYLIF